MRPGATAFGLELAGDLAGLPFPPVGRAAGARGSTTLGAVDPGEAFSRPWPSPGTVTTLRENIDASGERGLAIDRDATGAALISARGFGDCLVWPAGERIESRGHPGGEPRGRERVLIAQALPFAAVLQGLEVLHAAAVARDDLAFALVGAAGSGKSSLALALCVAGLELVTDDVLALSLDPSGGVTAHPGAASLALRASERELAARADQAGVVKSIVSGAKDYAAVERVEGALSLGRLLVLERGVGVEPVGFERLRVPDPRLLLGQTFNAVLTSRARLETQLEVHAALARSVPVERMRIPASVTPEAAASVLLEHLDGSRRAR